MHLAPLTGIETVIENGQMAIVKQMHLAPLTGIETEGTRYINTHL